MSDTTTAPPPLKRYLTVMDLARHLQCSRDTVYRMEEAGQLPGRVRFGKRLMWFGPAIEDWEKLLTSARK